MERVRPGSSAFLDVFLETFYFSSPVLDAPMIAKGYLGHTYLNNQDVVV